MWIGEYNMKTFSKFIAIIFDLSSLNLFNLSIEHFISNYCLMITKAPLILVIPSIGGLGFTILSMRNVL